MGEADVPLTQNCLDGPPRAVGTLYANVSVKPKMTEQAARAPRKSVARRAANARANKVYPIRQRILEVSRLLFYRQGYYGTKVGQIVSHAGTTRPTFYHYFPDKEAILSELVGSYASRAAVQMTHLPGPRPSLAALRAWLLQLADFLEQEKLTVATMGEVCSRVSSMPQSVTMALDVLLTALASRASAFAIARQSDALGMEARARVDLLMIEISHAAILCWKTRSPLAAATVSHVARSLHEFLHDPRFRSGQPTGERRSVPQA
jgi:AcrR family transcriptional regulator